MRESYHNPPAAQVKTWSPGRPLAQCAAPNATDALRRNADGWERSQVVRAFPQRPRPTSPTGEKRRVAA